MVDLPSPAQHGWTEEGDFFWTDEMFPETINDYVITNEDDEDEDDFEDDFEGDVFSDDDDEDSDSENEHDDVVDDD